MQRADAGLLIPTVFMYDLPHRLPGLRPTVLRWSYGFALGAPGCEELAPGSPERDVCTFGPRISVRAPTTGKRLTLRATNTFTLTRILHARLVARAASSRARRPEAGSEEGADLYVVPIWREPISGPAELATCPNASQIVSLLPALNEKTAHRHVLVSPRTGILGQPHNLNRGYDVCPVFQARGGSTKSPPHGRLLEVPPPSRDEVLIGRMLKIATEDTACCAGRYGHWASWAVPCANVASGLSAHEARMLREAARPEHSRPTLVMATLGLHGKHASLRAAWKRQCLAARPPECDYVDFLTAPNGSAATYGHDARGALGKDGWARVLSSMLNSTFCLQPHGDSPTRKSTLDSILLGCIPVLSHPSQMRAWPWHAGSRWQDFSMLHASSHGLLARLRAVPAAEVERLRRGLVRAARHLAYAREDGHADAVDVLLAGAQRVAGMVAGRGPGAATRTHEVQGERGREGNATPSSADNQKQNAPTLEYSV